jgi:hypothetical protein
MPERASVFENVKWGVESLAAPGVVVPAIKQLQSVGVEAQPKIGTSRFRPPGTKFDTQIIPGQDYSTLKLTGKLDFVNILYPLASVLNIPTLSTVGTNGRKWAFVSNVSSYDTSQTYTLDIGSPIRAGRVSAAQVDEFGISFKRDMADLSGTLIAKQYTDPVTVTGNAVFTLTFTGVVSGGTFTLTYAAQTTSAIAYNATASAVQIALQALSTIGNGNVLVTGGPGPAAFVIQFVGALGNQIITPPTGTFSSLTGSTPGGAIATTQAGVAVTVLPAQIVFPSSVSVFADTTAAALGTTRLLRVLQADFKIAGRWKPLWTINSLEASYAVTTESAADVTLKLKMSADGAGMAYLQALRGNQTTTYFFQISATGPALPAPDTAFNYAFVLQLACQVESPDSMGDESGAEAVDWTFRAVPDPTWGKALEIDVTNLQTAL